MARIPEAEIEALKLQVDLVALIRARGIELKPHGKDLVGHCPFHDDRTPSLVVTPSKNLWHCLGACQTGGTVIDWIMKMDRVKFRHAVELLRAGNSSALVAEKLRRDSPKLPSPLDPAASERELLRQVIDFYHETLKLRAPEGLSYLEARGIRSSDAIDKFKLGFSNRTLGIRLPESRRPEGGDLRSRLMKVGIYRESGHEHFSGSLVIPVIGPDGNVTEAYGRKIVHHLRTGTAYHTYLPGPHRGVWNPEALESPDVILCEALIDALSFWVHGIKNVTAAYGVEGFTKDHLAGFLKHGVRRVFIAYDRDEAGDRAAVKLSKKLLAEGIESLRVHFPRGMDANEFILKVKPADASLKLCVQTAEWMGKLPNRKAASLPPATAPVLEATAAPLTTAASETELPSLAAVPPPVPEEVVPAVEPPELFRKPEPVPLAPEEPVATDPAEAPIPPVSETTAEAAAERADAVLDAPTEIRGEDVLIRLGEREYRVRGLKKNTAIEALRVNLRVAVEAKFHVDTLDLYQAKARTHYVHAAARELGLREEILQRDLGRVLFKCEALQEEEMKRVKEPGSAKKEVILNAAEKAEALGLLCDPNLLGRILADFSSAGVIGEEVNKLVGYLAAISRKLHDPLAVIIQSSSAAGKSSLMEAILAMVPEEDKVKYSAMTGQSLFYMGETDLKHKILAIAEEQGASQAAYALKLLQSEGEISIASTGKDGTSGRLITHQYRVEGPVMIFLTTTAIEVDEELLNRCLVLTVNETQSQTRAIHELQRKAQTLEGVLLKQERAHVLRLHQNAQRLLRRTLVVNPFAEKLTFLDHRTRTRRDHMKYLALIRTIALLHQYQRKAKWTTHRGKSIEYIEVEPRDIEIANALAQHALDRGLDELPPQSGKLLERITEMVTAGCARSGISRGDYRFTRREVREFTGWSDFQVHVHLNKLAALEYVVTHRGGRGQSFVYELLSPARPPKESLTQSFLGTLGPLLAPNWGGIRSPEIGQESGSSVESAPGAENPLPGGPSPGGMTDGIVNAAVAVELEALGKGAAS
jgi:DNA primase